MYKKKVAPDLGVTPHRAATIREEVLTPPPPSTPPQPPPKKGVPGYGCNGSGCNVRIRLQPRLLPTAFTAYCPLFEPMSADRPHSQCLAGTGGWGGQNRKIHWGITFSPKMMILQGVRHPIHTLGYPTRMTPKRGGVWRTRLRLI